MRQTLAIDTMKIGDDGSELAVFVSSFQAVSKLDILYKISDAIQRLTTSKISHSPVLSPSII